MEPDPELVTGVGDTLVLLDPIAGQGANNGNKMARNLVESVVARSRASWRATTGFVRMSALRL